MRSCEDNRDLVDFGKAIVRLIDPFSKPEQIVEMGLDVLKTKKTGRRPVVESNE